MIIFYQIRSQLLKTVDLKEEVCPLCKHKGKVQMHILQKYMHLMGPINPLGKYGELDCGACETIIPAKKWNKELDSVYKAFKASAETPSRLWRGTWVLGIFFTTVFVFATIADKFPELLGRHNTSEQSSIELNEKLNYVKEGDVIAVDFAGIRTVEDFKAMYGIIKLGKITDDNVAIKIYTDRFGDLDFIDDLKKTDLDSNKFSAKEIMVSLRQITKNKQVMQEDGTSIGNHIHGFIN
jgi:hypothetical protein